MLAQLAAETAVQAEAAAQKTIQTFADYITTHKDEIAALGFFYQQPYQRRALTFDMMVEIMEKVKEMSGIVESDGTEVDLTEDEMTEADDEPISLD